MAVLTLEQALRNAIEAENTAYRRYTILAEDTTDVKAKKFLKEMAAQEKSHEENIRKMAERLGAGELPKQADDNVELIESSPGWENVDNISIEESLAIAREAEIHAGQYYDLLADFFEGEIATFFRDISSTEKQHQKNIDEIMTVMKK